MIRFGSITIIAVTIVILLAGCDSDKTTIQDNKELVLLCGSSFVPPSNELVEQFTAETGIEIVTTTAGSEDFLPLVKAGQKGDILITHDPYLDYVREADALAGNVQVGFVAPVLAVQKGNPKKLKSINDLTTAGLKVALTDPQYSTCGEMVFKLLENKGIKDAVMQNVGNRLTKGHPTLGNYLKTDAVDAVIMWNGVANTFRDDLDVVKTPYEYDTEIRVHVIGLNYSKHAELVKRFMDFTQQYGSEIFAKHGYIK
ncbi:MAG: substrate-binding domain-containing protein [Planctomycetota bacterium]|nr:MAG: substrate-binding domain-containing protein [Planctomycetota bacterium]